MAQHEGIGSWFNNAKGNSFLEGEASGAFPRAIPSKTDGYTRVNEGDPVTFDVMEGTKGLRADLVAKKKKAA